MKKLSFDFSMAKKNFSKRDFLKTAILPFLPNFGIEQTQVLIPKPTANPWDCVHQALIILCERAIKIEKKPFTKKLLELQLECLRRSE